MILKKRKTASLIIILFVAGLMMTGCGGTSGTNENKEGADWVPGNLSNGGVACVCGEMTYVIDDSAQDGWNISYISGGKRHTVYQAPDKQCLSSLQSDGKWVYFYSSVPNEAKGSVYRIDTVNQEVGCIIRDNVTDFCIHDGKIYSISDDKDNYLWVSDLDGSNRNTIRNLGELRPYYVMALGKHIVIEGVSRIGIYDLDDQDFQIKEVGDGFRAVCGNDDALYYLKMDDPMTLNKYSFDDDKQSVVMKEDFFGGLNVEGNYLYYLKKNGESLELDKLSLEEGGKSEYLGKIPYGMTYNMNFAGNEIYLTPIQYTADGDRTDKGSYVYNMDNNTIVPTDLYQ